MAGGTPSAPRALFSTIEVGGLRLPNRIVMAPLTRSRASVDAVPSEHAARYYAQRAGAGLIIAEATQILPGAQGYPRTPGVYSSAQIEAWKKVTSAVHEADGRIFLQLWHVGRIAHPENQPPGCIPVAPSPIAARGRIFTAKGQRALPVPRELAQDEIAEIVKSFATASKNAIDAGFDGVEIHGANGYLIDAFLHDGSNRRSDHYGGSIANRCRFLIEVCAAAGAAVGTDRVGLRLSPFGTFNDSFDSDPQALFAHTIAAVSELNLAYLHVINAEVSGDRTTSRVGENVCAFSRSHYRGVLVSAGGYDGASAERAIESGEADLIAFGRSFISNPDLPQRLERGQPLASADRSTFYEGGARGYVDYPMYSEPSTHHAKSIER